MTDSKGKQVLVGSGAVINTSGAGLLGARGVVRQVKSTPNGERAQICDKLHEEWVWAAWCSPSEFTTFD